MARRKEFDYFGMFIRAAEYSAQAADMLHKVMEEYDPDSLKDRMKEMHAVEHAADIAKHEMNRAIARAFITPIEREDIMLLTQELDDVTDLIEDVLLRLICLTSCRCAEALDFSTMIYRCCEAMEEMMREFRNFRKSGLISEKIVEINRLEEEADALYTKAVRRLYLSSKDPVELMVWSEIFDRMERCCDTCEHVANLVESIIMKNT